MITKIQSLAEGVVPKETFLPKGANLSRNAGASIIKSFSFFTNTIPGAGVPFVSLPFAPFWITVKPIRILKVGLSVEKIIDLSGDIVPGDGQLIINVSNSSIINQPPQGIQVNILATGLAKDFVAGGDSEQSVESPIIPANTQINVTLSGYNYGSTAALDQINLRASFFYEEII